MAFVFTLFQICLVETTRTMRRKTTVEFRVDRCVWALRNQSRSFDGVNVSQTIIAKAQNPRPLIGLMHTCFWIKTWQIPSLETRNLYNCWTGKSQLGTTWLFSIAITRWHECVSSFSYKYLSSKRASVNYSVYFARFTSSMYKFKLVIDRNIPPFFLNCFGKRNFHVHSFANTLPQRRQLVISDFLYFSLQCEQNFPTDFISEGGRM